MSGDFRVTLDEEETKEEEMVRVVGISRRE